MAALVEIPESLFSLAEAPQWLSEAALEANQATAPDQRRTGPRSKYIEQRVLAGGRNEFLFKRAAALRSAGFDEREIYNATRSINLSRCVPPLPDPEVQRIAWSAAGYATDEQQVDDAAKLYFKAHGITAAALEKKNLPQQTWAVEKLLPAGLAICAGRPKVCKSWLAYDLALHVALGAKVFGEYATQAGDTLYLALEDSDRRLQSRSRMLRGSKADPSDRVHLFTSWPKLHEEGLVYLERWLEYTPDTRLIVIDTLAKVRRPAKGNANMYTEDYEALEGMQRLAQACNVAVLCVHHTNKQLECNLSDPMDAISGSTGISGVADTLWLLKRAREDNSGTLLITGREVNEAKLAMRLEERHMRWVCEGDAESRETSEVRKELLALLRVEPMSPRQLAEESGRNRSSVRVMLMKMVGDGLVHKGGRGLYVVTQRGMMADQEDTQF